MHLILFSQFLARLFEQKWRAITVTPVFQCILYPGQVVPRGTTYPGAGCTPGYNLPRGKLYPTLGILYPGVQATLAGVSCTPGYNLPWLGYLVPRLIFSAYSLNPLPDIQAFSHLTLYLV